MKSLSVPLIEDLSKVTLGEAGSLLDEYGSSAAIESVNWVEQYPYKPLTCVRIGRAEDAFFIKYTVKGSMLKAVYLQDQSPVHEDSCVEFFCMPEGAKKYTNFEFNCIGTCSASSRKSRNDDIVPFSDDEMKSIERFSTIGKKPFKEIEGMFEWELTVKIPMKLMGLDVDDLPQKIRANFYKCADDTESIHFVSWSPIGTKQPDFHQPEYFGELIMDERTTKMCT